MPELEDILSHKTFVNSLTKDVKPLKTSFSQDKDPQKPISTYSLSSALQGVGLYKPPGITFDVFNNELGLELQDLGLEGNFNSRDSKLNPYDIFVKDPDPTKAGQMGDNLAQNTTSAQPGQPGGGGTGGVVLGEPNPKGWWYPAADKLKSPGDGGKFGDRGGKHYGVDLAGPEGTKILAARPGTVIQIPGDTYTGGGNVIFVDHGGGSFSTYFHLRAGEPYATEDGAQVEGGAHIGYLGTTGRSTGPHLHFQIHEGVTSKYPLRGGDGAVDPAQFLDF